MTGAELRQKGKGKRERASEPVNSGDREIGRSGDREIEKSSEEIPALTLIRPHGLLDPVMSDG